MKKKQSDLQILKRELMQDEEFAKEYAAVQPEADIIRAILRVLREP